MEVIKNKEKERKFLVKYLPEGYEEVRHNLIEQAYLSLLPEFRIRKIGNAYVKTEKGEGDFTRDEAEAPISFETFLDLEKQACTPFLIKMRHYVPLSHGNIAELDVYRNIKDLLTVEVEFKSNEKANAFEIPDWFGREITYDKAFKNKNLAKALGENPKLEMKNLV